MEKIKVLHLLQNSLPLISGSTIRSKYIFKFQRDFCQPIVLTSFIFKNRKNGKDFEVIDKIPHYRINKHLSKLLRIWNKLISGIINIIYKFLRININNEILYLPVAYFTKQYIKRLAKFYDVDIIHQHSHFEICKYSYDIAKKHDKPYVYEVRGFIEESMLANLNARKITNSKLIQFLYNKIKNQETKIIKKSDFVITLSDPMKDELIKRGIDKNKIELVPNSINPNHNHLKYNSNSLKRREITLGFFGQLRWYEGLEVLLKAIPILKKRGLKVKLIIIGNSQGNYLNFLKKIVNRLGIFDNIEFLNSVPHEEIGYYYSLVDMIVIPRLDCGVCRLVSPLKPLDAMYHNVLVIASELPALRWNIEDGSTGVLFEPENSEDLAEKIFYYYNHIGKRREIESYAKGIVETKFTWKNNVLRYKGIYEKIYTRKS
ncbi:MAG: glycosyltransferase family 4 protein [Candidatus Hodarchaeota archaeon]